MIKVVPFNTLIHRMYVVGRRLNVLSSTRKLQSRNRHTGHFLPPPRSIYESMYGSIVRPQWSLSAVFVSQVKLGRAETITNHPRPHHHYPLLPHTPLFNLLKPATTTTLPSSEAYNFVLVPITTRHPTPVSIIEQRVPAFKCGNSFANQSYNTPQMRELEKILFLTLHHFQALVFVV